MSEIDCDRKSYFIEWGNIDSLNVFFHSFNFLDNFFDGNFSFNAATEDKLLDSISDIFFFAFSPTESVHFDAFSDGLFKCTKIGFLTCWFDIKDNNWFFFQDSFFHGSSLECRLFLCLHCLRAWNKINMCTFLKKLWKIWDK